MLENPCVWRGLALSPAPGVLKAPRSLSLAPSCREAEAGSSPATAGAQPAGTKRLALGDFLPRRRSAGVLVPELLPPPPPVASSGC